MHSCLPIPTANVIAIHPASKEGHMNPLIVGEKHLLEAFIKPKGKSIIIEHSEIVPYTYIPDAFCTHVNISFYNRLPFRKDPHFLAFINNEIFLFVGHIVNEVLTISEVWEVGEILRSNGGEFELFLDADKVYDQSVDIKLQLPLNMASLQREIVDTFISFINDDIDDPYLLDDDLESQPIECLRGNIADLGQILEWTAIVFKKQSSEFCYLVISTSCDDYRASVEAYDTVNITSEGLKFADIILTHFRPTAYYWEYNDGHSGRRSGYSQRPQSINIPVDSPSALEKANALMQLIDWVTKSQMDTLHRTAAEELLKTIGE